MSLPRRAVLVAASVAIVGAAVPAAMASDPTNVAVSGGSLSITNPAAGDFSSVTLDGSAKTTYASFADFDVTDSRGTGAGWNVTVQATQFQEWDSSLNAGAGGYVTGGKTLPQNSLQMAALTVSKIDATSSAAPSITAGPYTVDAASAVKVASAAADGSGMGSYRFTQGDLDSGTTGVQPLKLSVPANAYAKLYRSEATVSVVSGP